MTRIFTNPQSFQTECMNVNVSLDLLLEAQLCVGKQETSRCFTGKCKRGDGTTASSSLIEDWIATLKYAKEYPDEKDNDIYQRPRDIIPLSKWNEYLEKFSTPIETRVVESWKKMSKKQLINEAEKYGITFGIKNNKANKHLLERMLEMVERRRTNFWEKQLENISLETFDNLNLKNIFELKMLAKELGIKTYHLKKEEIISKIEEKKIVMHSEEKDIFNEEYENMSNLKLKLLCKERGVKEYIQKSKEELIYILKELDKIAQQKRDRIVLGGLEIISRSSDHYINATQLCKAGNRMFKKWHENKNSKEFLEELSKTRQMDINSLVQITMDGEIDKRGTWVHPQVAINIAQWISAKFAVNVSEWVQQLISTGSVSIGQPVQSFCSLSEIDLEAMELEKNVNTEQFTRYSTIYIAYIGRGLVKIGFSDGNILKRNFKHLSSESQYPQYRIIKLFRVSGSRMERDLHQELTIYKVKYNKQKEVFKPTTNLTDFIKKIGNFLRHHDIMLKNEDLENRLIQIELWCSRNGIQLPNFESLY